ncbi:MAG: hypothetical protein WC607_04925 [Candidatus Micrarchaeia archaeon]
MEELKKKVNQLFYATAAVAVVLLVFILYFVVQLGSTNNRLEQAVLAQNTQFAARLTQIESRLSNLEYVNPYKAVSAQFYYDSSCTLCAWGADDVDQVIAGFAAKNVQLEAIDIASLAESPVLKAPAFHFADSDSSRNQYFGEFVTQSQYFGGYATQVNGEIIVLNNAFSVVYGEPCGEEGKARLDAFYFSDDLAAIQLIADAKNTLAKYDGVTVNLRCLPADANGENKCLGDIGEQALNESVALALEYEVNAEDGARFLLNCGYEYSASSGGQIEATTCSAAPDACALPTASPAAE